ncbi:hypothetical protein GCM10023156_50300 [Novipirellula rosea]|uniref:Uncharacterized protein n=1 Tax=Novipirellula rosea TaxID=1031540 RepID=A0ABP8NCI6_9BACT
MGVSRTTAGERMWVEPWFYEEIIRRSNEVVDDWLAHKCEHEVVVEMQCNFGEWIDRTRLPEKFSSAVAESLHQQLVVTWERLSRASDVSERLEVEQLPQVDRKCAFDNLDTSEYPPISSPIQKVLRFTPERVMPASPEVS